MSVPWRLARVGTVIVDNMFHAAITQFGDNDDTVLRNWAIALQRGIPNYDSDEMRFAAFKLFFLPMPVWETPPEVIRPSTGPIGEIRVAAIRLISTSASTLLRVGSGNRLAAESRILHIRHFNGRMTGVYTATGVPGTEPSEILGSAGSAGITGAAGSR